jgi:hypothetical protein
MSCMSYTSHILTNKIFQPPDPHSDLVTRQFYQLHEDSNPRQIFGDCVHCSYNSPPAMFFYWPQFPSYRKYLHRDSNPRQLFVVVTFVPVIFSLKQFWSWSRSSIVLSLRDR